MFKSFRSTFLLNYVRPFLIIRVPHSAHRIDQHDNREYVSDLRSNEHYLSSSENKA